MEQPLRWSLCKFDNQMPQSHDGPVPTSSFFCRIAPESFPNLTLSISTSVHQSCEDFNFQNCLTFQPFIVRYFLGCTTIPCKPSELTCLGLGQPWMAHFAGYNVREHLHLKS